MNTCKCMKTRTYENGICSNCGLKEECRQYGFEHPLIDKNKIRELKEYDIYNDETVIRHDIFDGKEQLTITYRIPLRKSKNPLTAIRYKNRSQILFSEEVIKLNMKDLISLKNDN